MKRISLIITQLLTHLGSIALALLMFLTVADVFGRYVLNAPIKGAAEMVGYSIVTAVFLQMASTLRAGRFTRVELLIEPLEARRPGAAHAFNALYHLVGAAMFALVTWGTWPKLADAWAYDEITGTPGVFAFVIWPFLAAVATSAMFIAVIFTPWGLPVGAIPIGITLTGWFWPKMGDYEAPSMAPGAPAPVVPEVHA